MYKLAALPLGALPLGALAAVVLGALACVPPGPPDVTLFGSPDCTTEGYLGLDGLRPQVPVDSMQLRQRTSGGGLLTLSSTGTECATATNNAACMSLLDGLPTAPGFHPCALTDCGHALTTTTGDLATSYPDTKSLAGFLGAIDTPMDAVMLVYAQGYDISCTDKTGGGVRAALNGDGYEVLANLLSPSCNPKTITGYQFHVTQKGALTFISSWPVTPVPGAMPCP